MATITTIHDNILAYNKELININSKITIKEYIHQINNLHYNIDISFINDLLELVTKNECCVSHTFLTKYKVSKLTKGSHDALKIFNNNNLIEDKDYEIRQLAVLRPQGGTNNINIYYLHPDAFKKILMRSRNTSIYCDYYILLERCIKYYNDLQLELSKLREQTLLEKLDITNINLKNLNDTNKELIQTNNKLNDTNKELIQSNNKLNESIFKLTQELSTLKQDLTLTSYKSVPTLLNEEHEHIFLIFKHKEEPIDYEISRVQRQLERSTIKKKLTKKYILISKIDYCTNPITFTQSLRETLNDIIEFNCLKFRPLNKDITDNQLISLIHNEYNKRLK